MVMVGKLSSCHCATVILIVIIQVTIMNIPHQHQYHQYRLYLQASFCFSLVGTILSPATRCNPKTALTLSSSEISPQVASEGRASSFNESKLAPTDLIFKDLRRVFQQVTMTPAMERWPDLQSDTMWMKSFEPQLNDTRSNGPRLVPFT